jgi:hypothetical protein
MFASSFRADRLARALAIARDARKTARPPAADDAALLVEAVMDSAFEVALAATDIDAHAASDRLSLLVPHVAELVRLGLREARHLAR